MVEAGWVFKWAINKKSQTWEGFEPSMDEGRELWKRLSPQNALADSIPICDPKIAFFSIMKEQAQIEHSTVQPNL